ncbi:hypothetical protein SGRIM128S_04457 [Streptomyces griseomycini]
MTDGTDPVPPTASPPVDPAARQPVHAASGKRLGAAHPRQEAPTDLRLVPPALAAWATAAVMLHAPPGGVAGTVAVSLVATGVLLAAGRGRRRRTGRRRATARSWSLTSGAAVLLCVAAAAGSAGLHGADLRRGPVPALAREYARVTAELEITADPRLTRPRAGGPRTAPTAVLIEADVRRVERPDAVAVVTRTPVLVIVDARPAPRTPPGGHGTERSPWLGLLPSTRLRAEARLAPAAAGGDRFAAVLRVKGRDGPEVVGRPSGPQRLAGRLRTGLREATDGLSADARALLPGLVVGDTSRVTPELDEAFRETEPRVRPRTRSPSPGRRAWARARQHSRADVGVQRTDGVRCVARQLVQDGALLGVDRQDRGEAQFGQSQALRSRTAAEIDGAGPGGARPYPPSVQ